MGQSTFALYYQKVQVTKQLEQSQRDKDSLVKQRQQLENDSKRQQLQETDAKNKLNDKIWQQQQQIEQLQAAKATKDAQKVALAAPALAAASVSVVAGCGDNELAHFIYMHESGCNLLSVNANGCIGIGQSCPGGSGLAADCPDWQTNYACQNAHFTKYAQRYGGWAGSYAFWLANHWW